MIYTDELIILSTRSYDDLVNIDAVRLIWLILKMVVYKAALSYDTFMTKK